MRDNARVATVLALVGAVLSSLAALCAPAVAAAPAADCQPYAARPCLFPYPDNRFTRTDRSSATGLRLAMPAAAMPANIHGARIAVGPYDRNDGFSPGSAIVLHVPGLDTAAALNRTGAVPLSDLARAYAARQPILLLDETTGARQLIWAELDANATSAATRDLVIHPARNLTEGHTYVVVLRNLRTASGATIAAPPWFARLRAGTRLPAAERSQRTRYARIFATLRRAHVSLRGVYEAWDFTVGSTQSLTGRMLAIRNAAFAQLGDRNLTDLTVAGRAPDSVVTGQSTLNPVNGVGLTSVTGTVSVPCYLVVCGASATPGFHYSSHAADALPTQIPGNVATAPFECIVPSTATPANPARISLYGHGLLGSHQEVEAGNVEAMSTEHNIVFCATDWWGLAEGDTLNDAKALAELNLFSPVIDRLQQGVLNTLFLGRLMLHPDGLSAAPAFESGGHPVIDTSHLYYDGNSQGGIEGGMTTAVAPDFTHAVLGVTGENYGNLLVQRSVDFAPFGALLYPAYPDPSLHPWLLDLIQQLWDRGDPDGYAQQMTSHPLPDTPAHQVLMQIAYGDFQVSDFAAAAEARTIGASIVRPALDLSTRGRDTNMFYGLATAPALPFHGSAIEIWDSGPGRVQPPPFANVPPVKGANNIDPHEDPRSTPAARAQKSAFLEPNGPVISVCGGAPCRSAVFTP